MNAYTTAKESYTVGSHEFYMGYSMVNKLALCLDAGHFHPTKVIDVRSCSKEAVFIVTKSEV